MMKPDPINESIGLELDMINILYVPLFIPLKRSNIFLPTVFDLSKSFLCKVTKRSNVSHLPLHTTHLSYHLRCSFDHIYINVPKHTRILYFYL